MKLEQGKYYRTRDGRKVYVDSPYGEEEYPFLGTLYGGLGMAWDIDGRASEAGSRGFDIVAEWPDETTIAQIEAAAYQRGYDAGRRDAGKETGR